MSHDVKLTRTRSVLTRLPGSAHAVPFGRSEEEVDDGANLRTLYLDPADVTDLGEPSEITVTIYPGDLLNDPTSELEEDGPEETHGRAFLEPVKRADGRWDWHLIHENGSILCGSDQGYETRSMAFEIGRRCLTAGYHVETRGWA